MRLYSSHFPAVLHRHRRTILFPGGLNDTGEVTGEVIPWRCSCSNRFRPLAVFECSSHIRRLPRKLEVCVDDRLFVVQWLDNRVRRFRLVLIV